MKIALLYGSSHGRTRKAVNESLERLTIKPDVFDVKDLTSTEQFSVYDILMFFCPTYGDEELQPDMEKFITDFSLDMSGKQFVICELGNYYGYEDFSLGRCKLSVGICWNLADVNCARRFPSTPCRVLNGIN